MPADWPRVPLGSIADPIERPITVTPGESYRTIGVKWWGEGAYERETIDGSQTAARTLYRVKAGDLIINKIWVRHGSTAIATEAVDGCAASGEFPMFALNPEKANTRWLHWLTKSAWFWHQCDQLSQGTSGKNRIKPEKFLTIPISLPPLAEQRRIVSRVDAIAARIADARRLREEADTDLLRLGRAMLRGCDGVTPTRMEELVRRREPDVKVQRDAQYHFAGVYCFGRGAFRGQVRQGMEFSYDQLTTLREGDFVYPKLMAWEGAFAVVPKECNGLVVSTEFPVFEVNRERVLPEVLDVYFRDPEVWPQVAGRSTGTNVRRRRLNPSDFLKYEFPLPPFQRQEQLRAVVNASGPLKVLQAEASADLDALLPAVLAKAFAGEL